MSQYIIYCRKSSESEERQILSIESQIKELKELAKRLSLSVFEILSESRSAKSPGRPVFGLLMKKVARKEIKGIICWKLDRLARNPIDGAEIVWALDQGNLGEIITPYNHLTNNSNDKFLMQLEFGMAKKYVDDLSDNIRRGNRAKLDKGWLPGFPPLGYLNEPNERTIVPDPETFKLVRKMWETLLQGISPLRIRNMATEEWGIRARIQKRRGGGRLSVASIYKIFGNSFYYGVIQRREGVFQGKHVPMITEEEYWRAQEILGRKGKPRPKEYNFAFTGLIRCGECGGFITAEEKINRQGRHYTYYHCTKKNRERKCSQKTIRLEVLEQQIADFFERIYVPENILNLAIEYLKKESEVGKQTAADMKKSLDRTLRTCLRKIENLNQMRISDLISDEEYVQEKKKLIDEKMGLEEKIKKGDFSGEAINQRTIGTFVFAQSAKEQFYTGTVDEKRCLLREIGSNLLLKDKKLTIHAEKPFVLLENSLPVVREEIERIEPGNMRVNKRESASVRHDVQLLWSLVKDVRTYFTERAKEEEREAIRHAA